MTHSHSRISDYLEEPALHNSALWAVVRNHDEPPIRSHKHLMVTQFLMVIQVLQVQILNVCNFHDRALPFHPAPLPVGIVTCRDVHSNVSSVGVTHAEEVLDSRFTSFKPHLFKHQQL